MNACMMYSLFTAMAAVSLLGAGPAFAQINPACPNCEGDPMEMAEEAVLAAIPLSVWVDQATYGAGDVITITGYVSHTATDVPVTLMIQTPSGNIVWVDQIALDENDEFEVQVASDLWSELGIYQVLAQYGHQSKDNKVQFELTVGSPVTMETTGCGASAVAVEDYCVEYEIMGGMVTGATVNQDDTTLVMHIMADEDGAIAVTFPEEVLEGVFLVLVDGEESDDVMIDGQSVHVSFFAGAESIEFFAAKVIPEFGAVAALVLAAALVSIIAVSARSRLGLAPRM